MKPHPSGHLFRKKNELASVFYAFNCSFFIPLVLADGDETLFSDIVYSVPII